MEEEIRELYEALEERERNIDELEAVLTNLEGENDKQQDELNARTKELQELQFAVKQLRQDNDGLLEEKTLLIETVNTQKYQLDEQKNILAVSAKASEEAKKTQKDGNQNLYRLEVENQRLRDTIIQIEENDDILVNEIETLVLQKSDFQQQSEEVASKCDSLHADLDEKARTISKLLHEKDKAESDLSTRGEDYRRDIEEWQRKDDASKSEISRLLSELEQERAKHKDSAQVKENEAFRTELTQVRQEKQRLHSIYDRCLLDKNQAERDLDEAIQALNQSKRDAKDHTASVLLREKLDATQANTKFDKANAKLESTTQRCLDAEEKIENLRNQLRCSEERNTLYEKSNGLAEVVRLQKQLDADVRRRDYDLKRLNHTLGAEMDKRRALAKACDWLKEKANLGPEFMFDNEEIRTALDIEDSRLQSENAELSRQIESLEGERTKLLSQMRERAIDLGEKGGRFLGMNPQQVATVMEFASNLRRGVVDLPLNDRSKEFLAEISILKSEKEVQRVAIAGLEREISTREPPSEGESYVLKQVLDNFAADNQQLRNEIAMLRTGGPINPKSSVLTPLMRQRAKEILGEELVAMPASAEVQFICAIDAFDKISQRRIKEQSVDIVFNSVDGRSELPVSDHLRDADLLDSNMNKKVGMRLNEEEKAQIVIMDEGFVKLTVKCKSLEDELTTEKKARSNAQQQLAETQAIYSKQRDEFVEIKSMRDALEETKQKLSGYVGDLKNLHLAILSVQESRIDSAKARKQMSCLNDIIREKSRLYDALASRIKQEGAVQKVNPPLSRVRGHREHKSDRGNREHHKSDHSTSTNSIDRSISRAVSSSGRCSPTLKQTMQKHLEDSLRIITEREIVIREQAQKIVELTQKLLQVDESYQNLVKEAERMKTDISTLVSRVGEVDSAMNGMSAYQQKCNEAQDSLDKAKKEVKCLNNKLNELAKECALKEAKVKDLLASEIRTKSFLSVARQGRARSEEIVKASNEEVTSIRKSLEDMGSQMNALKIDKIEAQNEKLKMSRKARETAIKLKGLTENENSKTVEELTKRVDVLNKTVSGLAAQNSSLRIALAESKQKKRVDADVEPTTTITRGSISRERRQQSLEDQVKLLEKSLAEEKRKKSTDNSPALGRCEERIIELENELQLSAGRNSTSDDSQHNLSREQVKSLTSENKSLKQRIDEMNRIKDERVKIESNADAQLAKAKAENDVLKRENERLARIDHLDLFEEIEDLKFKYNEAVRQINYMTNG